MLPRVCRERELFVLRRKTQVWTKRINETVDLLYELYYLSKTDVDNTAITWYYALCMELLLDAAMILETYEACHDFYARSKNFLRLFHHLRLATDCGP